MIPPHWQGAFALFDEVSGLPRSEQRARLEARGLDPDLRAQVERLLAADAAPNPVFEAPHEDIAGLVTRATADVAPEEDRPTDRAGEVVGPYRLLRRVGRGGMGEVYVAERADAADDRRVAVKLVRRGMDTEDVLGRFRAERRILAALEHPNIARMYDGGVGDDERPYLVMEYVEGVPIDRFCEERGLGLEQRLDLFREVCRAVQHAHQNLVVHRDLKPSNILVEDEGTVKLLDFGIARLLEGDAGEAVRTRTGVRLLTPRYASPEQLAGGALTTASDLYSLGVVLYELLTGSTPSESLRAGPTADPVGGDAAGSTVRAGDPLPPSAMVLHTGRVFGVATPDFETPIALPPDRRTVRLARELRGDLDTIVLRALRAEPGERFPSASALEEDVRRFRSGLPIESRPDSAAYRLRKFVARHRVGVAAAFLTLVAVGSSAVISFRQAELARQQRDTAEQVSVLLEDLFSSSNPMGFDVDRPDTLRIRDLMAAAASRVTSELEGQPEVQARLLQTLGNVHHGLGLYEEAAGLFRSGLVAAERGVGLRSERGAALRSGLGLALAEAGRHEAADSALREALSLGTELLGTSTLPVAETQERYGRLLLLQRRYDEALPLIQASLATRRAELGSSDPLVASSLTALSAALTSLERPAESIAALDEAVSITRASLGADHPNVATMLHNLSFQYRAVGRYVEAEVPAREALSIATGRLGADHPEVGSLRTNLAQVVEALGRPAEADSLFEAAIASYERGLGSDHPEVAFAVNNYGVVRRRRGDLEGAAPLIERAFSIQRSLTGDDHPSTAVARTSLAALYIDLDRSGEALPLLERSMPVLESTFGPEHPRVIDARTSVARALMGQGLLDQADDVLRESVRRARPLGERHPVVLGILRAQADLYDVAGRVGAADSVRAVLEEGGR